MCGEGAGRAAGLLMAGDPGVEDERRERGRVRPSGGGAAVGLAVRWRGEGAGGGERGARNNRTALIGVVEGDEGFGD